MPDFNVEMREIVVFGMVNTHILRLYLNGNSRFYRLQICSNEYKCGFETLWLLGDSLGNVDTFNHSEMQLTADFEEYVDRTNEKISPNDTHRNIGMRDQRGQRGSLTIEDQFKNKYQMIKSLNGLKIRVRNQKLDENLTSQANHDQQVLMSVNIPGSHTEENNWCGGIA
jgi:hypothetical protein